MGKKAFPINVNNSNTCISDLIHCKDMVLGQKGVFSMIFKGIPMAMPLLKGQGQGTVDNWKSKRIKQILLLH